MSWTCTRTEERLSDFLDGNLSAVEQGELSGHAAGCARCARLVAQVGGVLSRVHNLKPIEEPPQIISRILDQTLGPRVRKSGWRRWFSWAPTVWQPRFAMGAVTVVASFLIVSHSLGVNPARLRRANLSPADVFRAANRRAHLVYARGVKFVNDLRVVYEIQSRLQPLPAPGPAPEPEAEPDQSPGNQQQKSESGPHPGRTANSRISMLAFVLTTEPGRSLR